MKNFYQAIVSLLFTLFSLSSGVVLADDAPPIVAVKRDCSADLEKFCGPGKSNAPKTLPEGSPAPVARGCLREHLKELSPACRAHYERADQMHKKAPSP